MKPGTMALIEELLDTSGAEGMERAAIGQVVVELVEKAVKIEVGAVLSAVNEFVAADEAWANARGAAARAAAEVRHYQAREVLFRIAEEWA